VSAELLLRAVLAVLAAYHLGIGLASVLSGRLTRRVAGALYGIGVEESAQMRYAVRMLGLYALALGALLVPAVLEPAAHRDVIVVVCGLQLARAACRVLLRRELTAAFHVSPRRNAFNAALLVAEAAVLAVLGTNN
jgi:hypothetical protein